MSGKEKNIMGETKGEKKERKNKQRKGGTEVVIY